MTTPYSDDPSAKNRRADGAAGGVTPGAGTPAADDAEERVHAPRLLAWLLVFVAIAIGVALYLIYAARLSPLLD
jgi:hypothetical protein